MVSYTNINLNFNNLVFLFFVFLFISTATGSRCSNYNYNDYYGWWGPEETKNNTNTSIIQFEVVFEDEMIADLRSKLNSSGSYTPSFKDTGFAYGVNVDYLRNLSKYWAEEYNFTERANYINSYSHFYTYIQGLKIHFVRYRTNPDRTNSTVLPILFLHGWPGSFLEFYGAIKEFEILCQALDIDFDIIVPSLPGFGYSDGAVIPGLGANEASVVLRNLMRRLGFNKFYIQGGDWGGIIAAILSVLFCDEVSGYHTNFPLAFTLTSLATYIYGTINQDSVVNSTLAARMYPAIEVLEYYLQETGYFHIHAAKPDTIGLALSSSPNAFLAWILQIISSMNPNNINLEDGGVEDNLSRDAILDNIMLYWANQKITTSTRLYAESCTKKSLSTGLQAAPVIVPTWVIQARYEFVFMTENMLKSRFLRLVNTTILPMGQHFLAWEHPKLFAQSVVDAVTTFIELSVEASECS